MSRSTPLSVERLTASSSHGDDLPAVVRGVLTRIAVGDHVTSDAFAAAFQASINLFPPARDVVLGSLMTAVMARGPVANDVEALTRK
jgi:anthranilate phosphoribosyltransferase